VLKRWITKYPTELLLFCLLLGSYAYFYQSTHHNEAARFDQLRAIVEKHTLKINNFWWNTADVIHYQKDGTDQIYPNKAPGMTLLSVVPYTIVSFGLSILRAVGFPAWAHWHTVVYLVTLLAVSALSALAAVLFHRVLSDLTGKKYFSALTIIAVWLGTLVFPYSTLFFSHQFAAALLAFAFYLLFRLGRDPSASTGREQLYSLSAGMLMSFSVASEYPTILLAAILFGYGVRRMWMRPINTPNRVRLMILCAGGALVGAGMLLLYNQAAFGKPFYIPYESYAKATGDFSKTYSRGWLGLYWGGFDHFFDALTTITVSPQIGMLYLGLDRWRVYACSPVLWLCLPGFLVMLWKKSVRLEGITVLVMTVFYLLFITNYGSSPYDWAGASYFGSRHLVPLLPFLALPLYFGARYLRPIFYPLLAVSIFYMLIGTATEPRVAIPYENTARDLLLPDYQRARFAQNTDALFDGQRNLVKDSAAFNLGKLVRLPAHLQLMPLLEWWALVGAAVLICARKAEHLNTSQPKALEIGSSPPIPKPAFPRATLIGVIAFVILVSLPPMIHHAAASARYKQHGLLGKYYRNPNCSGVPADTSIDSEINFDWSKTLPLPPPFSIEWTGGITIEKENDYQFGLIADDGAKLEIDGQTVVDVSNGPVLQTRMGLIHLKPGVHNIRVAFYNPLFGALVKLSWIGPAKVEEIVPTDVLIPPAQLPQK
jgi:hypothetical protein